LAYQPANSVFLSHQTSQQYFSPWLITQSSRNEQAAWGKLNGLSKRSGGNDTS